MTTFDWNLIHDLFNLCHGPVYYHVMVRAHSTVILRVCLVIINIYAQLRETKYLQARLRLRSSSLVLYCTVLHCTVQTESQSDTVSLAPSHQRYTSDVLPLGQDKIGEERTGQGRELEES